MSIKNGKMIALVICGVGGLGLMTIGFIKEISYRKEIREKRILAEGYGLGLKTAYELMELSNRVKKRSEGAAE